MEKGLDPDRGVVSTYIHRHEDGTYGRDEYFSHYYDRKLPPRLSRCLPGAKVTKYGNAEDEVYGHLVDPIGLIACAVPHRFWSYPDMEVHHMEGVNRVLADGHLKWLERPREYFQYRAVNEGGYLWAWIPHGGWPGFDPDPIYE